MGKVSVSFTALLLTKISIFAVEDLLRVVIYPRRDSLLQDPNLDFQVRHDAVFPTSIPLHRLWYVMRDSPGHFQT